MKIVVLAALSALPFLSTAQQASKFKPFSENGIYLSATDYRKHTLTDGFNNGQAGYRLRDETFKNGVKVTVPNTGQTEISDNQLWGERKAGVDYRRIDGDLYRIEHADRIFVYSQPANPLTIGSPAQGNTTYYFSRTANSPIHRISPDALKDTYYDQSNKMVAFEALSDLYNDPAHQAAQLVRLFYTDAPATQSTTRVAD